jgi:hypothetical protein|tara:strand:+ start:2054 stop:2569 length:516 start_codon:yes stop_codon:yes gene_type:complete
MKVAYFALEAASDAIEYARKNARLSGPEMLRWRKCLRWFNEEMKDYRETKQEQQNCYIAEHSLDGKQINSGTQPEELRELVGMLNELGQEEVGLPWDRPVLSPEAFDHTPPPSAPEAPQQVQSVGITAEHFDWLCYLGLAEDPDPPAEVGRNGDSVEEPAEAEEQAAESKG